MSSEADILTAMEAKIKADPDVVVREVERIAAMKPIPPIPDSVADNPMDQDAAWGVVVTLNRAVLLYTAAVAGGVAVVVQLRRTRWGYRFALAASLAANAAWWLR